MPKSNAEMARESMARKRQRAREAGFCLTCCKRKPNAGRAICASCITAALQRKRRKRKRDRETVHLRHVIIAHEEAGNVAHQHHLYADAAQHYQQALDVPVITRDERSRIEEKLAYALSLSGDPEAANPWFDRALSAYLANPAEVAKAVKVLFQRARHLWLDARTESALPLLQQAIQIAKRDNDPYLSKMANTRMANYLIGLSRYKEATSFLNAVGDVGEGDNAGIRSTYYTQRAILDAEAGNGTEMYAYFDQAIDAAKEDPDIFSIVSVWSVYGTCAWWLGNIEQAKTCLEQALLVSRQYHLTWSIPHLCLMYSELLFAMGRYGTAYEYLLDALAYDAQTPLMDVSFASVGIQVALYMKDEAALKKCIRPSVIEFAFRSGQPLLIGNIASAFAKWYIAYGHEHEAEALLHRAITTIDCRNSGVDFLIAVARYGRLSDVPRARIFWASRALRPCAGFFQASLALFDALVAQRRGNYAGMRSYAIDAMERCEALGLHDYVDLARTLLPAAMKIESTALLDDKPFTRVPALTIREQQVAELVLKGMTNQAIANALSITENTIEKHVASVMNKLGIRSRYQLADVLAHAEAEKRFGNRLG